MSLPYIFPKCHREGKFYILDETFQYYTRRYKKFRTVPKGFPSDGASFIATDILSASWWVHDALCKFGCWDDGTPCSRMEAATVLFDILKGEGRWFRARSWWLFTGPLSVVLYGNKLPVTPSV